MQLEFELNSRLKGMETQQKTKDERIREDRKDQRVDRQAAHQKQMIDQRSGGEPLKNFESSGNDILTGDAGLERFNL